VFWLLIHQGRETYVIGKDGIIKLVYNNQVSGKSCFC